MRYLKKFSHLGRDIYFAEKDDGDNPSFPLNSIGVRVEDFEKILSIIEIAKDLNDIETADTLEVLQKEVIEKYDIHNFNETIQSKKDVGMFIFKYKEDVFEKAKLDKFKENAKNKFGLNSVYVTYLEKEVFAEKSEEAMALELSILKPKKVMVFMPKEKVSEWVENHLIFFDSSYI